MTERLGLIVGSAFDPRSFNVLHSVDRDTPYGRPSSPLMTISIAGRQAYCLARHGPEHTLAPHEVNYRANVWAMREAGVDYCVGLNVVGGISPTLGPCELAVPDQLIDYTWGRASTFAGNGAELVHVEFTEPFDAPLRGRLAAAVAAAGFAVNRGTYGVTQGPRLETAAEIERLARDGCTMVGMTAMPEAALARELSMPYAILAGSVNFAAGRSPAGASIPEQLAASMRRASSRMTRVIEVFARDRADSA